MSRNFVRTSSQYLNVGSAPVTVTPLSVSLWFYKTDTYDDPAAFALHDGNLNGDYFAIIFNAGVGQDWVRATVKAGGSTGVATSTAEYSLNTWHHAAGVFTSSTSRAVLLDGGNKGTNSTNLTPSGIDNTDIARINYGSWYYYNGRVAEVGLWSAALADDEVAALAGRVSPTRIRPDSLVAYWPLYGIGSPEPDYRGTYNLTLNNNPTQADHAPVQPPFGLDVWAPMGLLLLPHLGGIAWGEQHPTMGEMPEKWSTWSDGAGGSPTVDGDPDWGKLYLACAEEGRSLVYDLTNANPRWYTLTENRYGAGSGTAILQIRGDTDPFGQDDGEPPNWENYAAPILRSWRYVQARESH